MNLLCAKRFNVPTTGPRARQARSKTLRANCGAGDNFDGRYRWRRLPSLCSSRSYSRSAHRVIGRARLQALSTTTTGASPAAKSYRFSTTLPRDVSMPAQPLGSKSTCDCASRAGQCSPTCRAGSKRRRRSLGASCSFVAALDQTADLIDVRTRVAVREVHVAYARNPPLAPNCRDLRSGE